MAVIRPPAPVIAVPAAWVHDARIDALAFRLLVLLHDESLPSAVEEDELARTLGVFRSALDEALHRLEAVGYLTRHITGGWQVAR